jgi:DNA-binding XRE family transcriptional regulator
MTTRKQPPLTQAARQSAERTRQQLGDKPPPAELLTPQERADAAPFYFVLREYIRQLKEAREAAGLTLADVSARTGMAVESLSRLETGAQTNPTWKTLGAYAKALGRRPQLVLEAAAAEGAPARVEPTGPTPPTDGSAQR